MTAEEARRLPPSVGGLLDLAGSAYAERFGVYTLLAAAVLVACALPEFGWIAHGDAQIAVRENVVLLVEGFGDAFVIAVVAIGVAARLSESARPGTGAVLSLACVRWFPVIGIVFLETLVEVATLGSAGLGPIDKPLLTAVSAPLTWLLWGVIALAAPIAALSNESPGIAMAGALWRAAWLSLRPANLARLCLVAFASVVPMLLQQILADAMERHGVAPNAGAWEFWIDIPLDALTVGPLAALQTVFALDFLRRSAELP